MSSTYNHPRPYVAIDCVPFSFVPSSSTDPLGSLRLLLKYRREEECWGLPGSFLRSAEHEKLKVPTSDDKNCSEEEVKLVHERYSEKDIERYSNEENEYGPEAETIGQCFRRALEVELALSINNKKVGYHLSESYIDNENVSTGLRSEDDFREDEFCVQLPLRSQIDRDKDRIDKQGKHPNYRVISIPILHLCRPKEVREPNQSDLSQWIPLSWVIEDNRNDPEIAKLFDYNGAAANWKKYPRDPQLSEYNYKLAFDHPAILASAIRELRKLIRVQGLGRELLPAQFKLTDLQRLYEEILGGRLDPTSFRKTVLERGKTVDPLYYTKNNLVIATDETYTNQAGRKSKWLRFNDKVYDGYLERLDFNFSLQLI